MSDRASRDLAEFVAQGYATPPLPEGWENTTWANDVCPSYWVANMSVYMDHPEQSAREFYEDSMPRFTVFETDSEGARVEGDAILIESDEWDSVLAFVASRPS